MKPPSPSVPAPATPLAMQKHIGQRVRYGRRVRNLTQRDLAAALGCTYQQVQKYEAGISRTSSVLIWRISLFLGFPVDYFYQGLASDGEIDFPVIPENILATVALLKDLPPNQQKAFTDFVQSLTGGGDEKNEN